MKQSFTWYGMSSFLLHVLGCISVILIVSTCTIQAQEENKPQKPNILFALADDISYPHMGVYGTEWVQTPAFDRVAGDGILFNRAYTPNPKCAPSRAIILTGRNTWELEEAANHGAYFPQKFKVYPEALAENGYFVGYTGKGWAPGLAETEDGEPRFLTGKPFDEFTTDPPTAYISNTDYAANFKSFLESQPEDEPFAFWYGSREPHRAYEYRSGIEKGGKKLSDIDEVPYFWPDDDEIRIDMLDYAYEIEYFDLHLGMMLEILEDRDMLDNTIVVVTSDNGMPFPRSKGQAYEISAHMPLAIMWPAGIENPGRVIEDYVSFIDFAPTFIELAGLPWQETGMYPSSGRSLTDIFYTNNDGWVNPARDHLLIGYERHDVGRPYDWGYPVRGIIRDDMLYIHNFEPDRWPAGNPETGYTNTDRSPTKTVVLETRTTPGMHHYWRWSFGKRPKEELYNVARDPGNIHNLADNPEYRDIKEKLKAEMFEALKEQEDPRMFGRGYIFDSYTHFRNANFYERFMAGENPRAGWVDETDFEDELLPEQRQ